MTIMLLLSGEMFHQMSSLVMEQSETILRIEDDIEEGLANTVEVCVYVFMCVCVCVNVCESGCVSLCRTL